MSNGEGKRSAEDETWDATVDHEQYAGEEMPDPWEDETQTDWPMNPEGGSDGSVGADGQPDSAD